MIPKLRFPEFTHDWFEASLQDEYDYKNAKAHEPYVVENGRYKLINSKFISTEGKKFKTVDSVLTKGSVGDVTMVLSDLPNGKALAKAYYVEEDDTYAINQRICRLRVLNKHKNDSKFFYYLINRNSYFLRLDDGITQTHISKGDVLNFRYNTTQLNEQTRIRDLFNCVDHKINLLTKKKEALETYKKGLMQKIFSQELRFKREDGTDYPEWEATNLGELCNITTGKLDANAQVEDGEYLFFTCAKEVYRIDEYAFEGASLLISGNGANVGYIHNYEGRFNAYQRTYVLQNVEVNRDYLQYYLEQNLQRRIHREKKDGNTPYIVMSTLTMMKIAVPSENEAYKIARALSTIDDSLEQLSKKLNSTVELKKGLLQQMFV